MESLETGAEARLSRRPGLLNLISVVVLYAVMACFFFFARMGSGTLGWSYIGLYLTGSVLFSINLIFWNPELLIRRASVNASVKMWDHVVMALYAVNVLILFFVVVRDFDIPGNDLAPAGVLWLTGLIIFTCGWIVFTWSSFENPFFEKMVRIQTEEGHFVIDRGPYSVVRHPGYVGFISANLATMLLLSSYWVVFLSTTMALLFVIRTALEDLTLKRELPGYLEYASRVPCRLIPGLW